ncbi:unnamed protein product [Paramecium pentaurelia]|uniref:Uncharacterized protein n=1 Tax=Paramecium pentaurelia TaxID=43138 RepID=A0A8S1U4P0_9CILI|nr:unnamed protein product [Paramecium pentaurelia]
MKLKLGKRNLQFQIKDYHNTQEDLMLVQAEVDAFKQRGNATVVKVIIFFSQSKSYEIPKANLFKENILNTKQSQVSQSSQLIVRPLKEVNI